MSTFSKKALKGEVPSDQEWAEHLVEAHRSAPGMTPQAFANCKTSSGINSYELLAESVSALGRSPISVVDLACGDGHLIGYLLPKLDPASQVTGIDMSDAELALAKNNFKDQRVSFIQAQAQNIPLPARSTDLVLCHMALMLMLPIEPVIQEISRVLKPQGIFSSVVGGSKDRSGLFSEILSQISQFFKIRYSMNQTIRTGDPRVSSPEGIQSLFTPEFGFSSHLKIEDFSVRVYTTPGGVWNFVKDFYFVGMLPDTDKSQLKLEIVALANKSADDSGHILFEFPMRKLTAIRT